MQLFRHDLSELNPGVNTTNKTTEFVDGEDSVANRENSNVILEQERCSRDNERRFRVDRRWQIAGISIASRSIKKCSKKTMKHVSVITELDENRMERWHIIGNIFSVIDNFSRVRRIDVTSNIGCFNKKRLGNRTL